MTAHVEDWAPLGVAQLARSQVSEWPGMGSIRRIDILCLTLEIFSGIVCVLRTKGFMPLNLFLMCVLMCVLDAHEYM